MSRWLKGFVILSSLLVIAQVSGFNMLGLIIINTNYFSTRRRNPGMS